MNTLINATTGSPARITDSATPGSLRYAYRFVRPGQNPSPGSGWNKPRPFTVPLIGGAVVRHRDPIRRVPAGRRCQDSVPVSRGRDDRCMDRIEPDVARRIGLVGEWTEPDYMSMNLSEDGALQVMQALVRVGVGIAAGV
jgi:hypothetical protein